MKFRFPLENEEAIIRREEVMRWIRKEDNIRKGYLPFRLYC